ncbi:MAG: imidazole glycerol phosphate synthase subunit HisH [Gammaproteobacteria bacterium]|nr:imidazole glycerol phosphate synthase subunit HisH [Gammaproteobacteria bacterium]
MTSIIVVDFGMGNLRSVAKAFEHVAPGADVMISADVSDIRAADRVVLPGQGAIGGYIKALYDTDLEPAVLDAAANKPFLGICLGQQVLYESSDEHGEEGESVKTLGLFKGHAKHFTDVSSDPQAMINPQTGHQYPIPHMGWNQVKQTMKHPLWQGIADMARFYFVHSYCLQSENEADVAGVTEYGVNFTSATARDNIFAVQFHPEKSQHDGLKLLENFVNWKI